MQLTSSLVLFALGASAAATPHQRHQRFHEKKNLGDMVTATIDGVVVSFVDNWSGGATASAEAPAPAAATPTSAPVVAAEKASDSDASTSAGNSGSATVFTPFCGGAAAKRATLEQINYQGNIGVANNYGCNQQLIDSSIADQYDYTVKFVSHSSEEQQCVCWNKIAPDGKIGGWFGHPAVEFTLPAGSEQTVAIDSDTQGGCSCGAGSVPVDVNGGYAGTWLEFDMDNTSNDHNSGADISALAPMNYNMFVQGMSVCGNGQCSSVTDNAQNNNAAYVKGMEAVDGVGVHGAPGKFALEVVVDYQG